MFDTGGTSLKFGYLLSEPENVTAIVSRQERALTQAIVAEFICGGHAGASHEIRNCQSEVSLSDCPAPLLAGRASDECSPPKHWPHLPAKT